MNADGEAVLKQLTQMKETTSTTRTHNRELVSLTGENRFQRYNTTAQTVPP